MRKAIAAVGFFIAAIALLPWGLYAVGLAGVEGRPVPLEPQNRSPELMREQLTLIDAPTVCRLSPWGFFARIVSNSSQVDQCAVAAEIVARHFKGAGDAGHLSVAALTIWVSRNWTSDQMLDTASSLLAQDAQGRLLHYGVVGFGAMGMTLLAMWLAGKVEVKS